MRIVVKASILFVLLLVISCTKPAERNIGGKIRTGNVIFIHPDGCGLATWNALRILDKGPDNNLNWDKLSHMALYRSHIKNTLSTSSNAGAVAHAYGVKTNYDSYGQEDGGQIVALSGESMPLGLEAIEKGIAVGIINSGELVEPGTGVFVAASSSRKNDDDIAKKIIQSGCDLMFFGGENQLLPEGTEGRFTSSGTRKDGINLIKWATENGYKVIYNKTELENIEKLGTKVLGVFGSSSTFNDKPEEELQELKLENYNPEAPTVAEMTAAALKYFKAIGKQFLLVVEEEGTDNFSNKNNASGVLEALRRSDAAIAETNNFIEHNPNTMLIVGSDSEAGGMEIVGFTEEMLRKQDKPLQNDPNGAPWDGPNGQDGKPFYSAPDKSGKSFPFFLAWSSLYDTYGSVVFKASGLNSDRLKGNIDNTDIYRLMYYTLFGRELL